MKLDPTKFKTNESRSNHLVVAQQYPDCPINEICFYLAVGFCVVMQQCNYIKTDGETAECMYHVENKK